MPRMACHRRARGSAADRRLRRQFRWHGASSHALAPAVNDRRLLHPPRAGCARPEGRRGAETGVDRRSTDAARPRLRTVVEAPGSARRPSIGAGVDLAHGNDRGHRPDRCRRDEGESCCRRTPSTCDRAVVRANGRRIRPAAVNRPFQSAVGEKSPSRTRHLAVALPFTFPFYSGRVQEGSSIPMATSPS